MRTESRNRQIKFSSRLNCAHQDVCLSACSLLPLGSGCRMSNHRRQPSSQFNQLERTLCGLMDKRNGKRHNFFTETATSSADRIQPSARQNTSFSGGRIPQQVWQPRVPDMLGKEDQLTRRQNRFVSCLCRTSAPEDCISVSVLMFMDMQHLF